MLDYYILVVSLRYLFAESFHLVLNVHVVDLVQLHSIPGFDGLHGFVLAAQVEILDAELMTVPLRLGVGCSQVGPKARLVDLVRCQQRQVLRGG